jgi:hypothetical protein
MRRPWLLFLLPLALLPASCVLLDRNVINAPPEKDEKALARWWNGVVEQSSPDFLAVYLEASQAHLREGSSATYVDSFTGLTMVGKHHRRFELPAPPPEPVLVRIRERLKGHQPAPLSDSWQSLNGFKLAWHCRGCTPERAMRIWEEAVEKVHAGTEGPQAHRADPQP